jgi:uncharacterized protein YktA (UPF0223 family)
VTFPPITPPTDNLYKFAALSGLVLLLVSIIYPQTRMDALNARIYDFNCEIEEMKVGGETLAEHFKAYKSQIFKSDAEGKSLAAATEELQKHSSRMAVRSTEIDYLKNRFRWWERVCGIGAGLGLLIMGYGFMSWYLNLQRPQDRLLQKELAAVK